MFSEIKTLCKYDSAFPVFQDYAPDLLKLISDDARDTLNSFDDYESIIIFVINDDYIITADSVTGDVTGPAVTIKEFFFNCLEYCADFV